MAQSFLIEVLAQAAFKGLDNSNIQLVWTDITPGVAANATLLTTVNGNATDVGSLVHVTVLSFYQRTFRFEYHNLDDGTSRATAIVIIIVLSGALIIVLALTLLFLKHRYVCVYACAMVNSLTHTTQRAIRL